MRFFRIWLRRCMRLPSIIRPRTAVLHRRDTPVSNSPTMRLRRSPEGVERGSIVVPACASSGVQPAVA